MNEALPFLVIGLPMVAAWLIALIGMLTARDDGSAGRPRWPARYPAGPRRDTYGAARRRLAAALLTDDARWTDRCERAGWEPSDDGEQVRT